MVESYCKRSTVMCTCFDATVYDVGGNVETRFVSITCDCAADSILEPLSGWPAWD
jgi:hypothetical protein